MNGSQRPVSATPSLLDRVTALCESEEERAVIQRLCIELNIGPGGAELAYVLLTLEIAAMVRRRGKEPEKSAGAVVLVSVQPSPKPASTKLASRVSRSNVLSRPFDITSQPYAIFAFALTACFVIVCLLLHVEVGVGVCGLAFGSAAMYYWVRR